MKKILLALTIFAASCTASKPLYNTGHYKVTTARKAGAATIVTFQNVKGSYTLPTDTVKVGDVVQMIKVTRPKY